MAVLLRHLYAIMLGLWGTPPLLAFCMQVGAGQPSVLRAQLLLEADADIAGSRASKDMLPEAGDPMASFLILQRRLDEAYALGRNVHAHAGDISQLELAVKPAEEHIVEGLGGAFQHYRNSLSYALALGLPWVGRMFDSHDSIDYTEMLGLCQPLCQLKEDSRDFKQVRVPKSFVDLEDGVFTRDNWTNHTLLVVSENHGKGWYGDLNTDTRDFGHTKYLAGVRERYQRVMPTKCPHKPYIAFHYRWGDVQTGDFEHPNRRGMNMTTGASIIASILRTCDLDVKLMSEGDEVGQAFAQRFPGAFKYIDGAKSHDLAHELHVFACSTVLIGGYSSFSVVGALLSGGLVITTNKPESHEKFEDLNAIFEPIDESNFEEALRNVAPEACAKRPASK